MSSVPAQLSHRKLIGISLISAPGLMLLGDSWAGLFGESGFWPLTLLLWLSFYVYVAACLGMMALSGGQRLALVGCAIALFGTLIAATIMGLERMAWAMRLHGIPDEQVSQVLLDPTVFSTSRAPGLAFPVGLLLLTVALFRAGVLSGFKASVLAIGILLFPVGRIFVGIWANVIGDALMLLVMAPLGVRLLPSEANRASPAAREVKSEKHRTSSG